MRMTVLSVGYPLAKVSNSTAGGAEQVLLTLDRALVRFGHRSLVLAAAGSESHGLLLPVQVPKGVLAEKARRESQFLFRQELQKALRLFPIDVVHMHGLDFNEYLPETDLPVIVTLHLPLTWYAPGALQLKHDSTSLLCVSESQARSAPANARVEKVIPNGIEINDFRCVRKKGDYVLAMGRICPEKGFHLAMEAAAQAGGSLILAGTVFLYPEHRHYFEARIAPSLEPRVRFIGQVGGIHKRKLLAGAKCLLVPSLVPETSSLIAMEALASGTPVIAMRTGALPEIVTNGQTGFLVDSVEEMADAIRRIHEIDPQRCRQEAEAKFSAAKMIASYLRLYEAVRLREAAEELLAA
jgi:glycosyltransferase involved in cell wall biosynthesis